MSTKIDDYHRHEALDRTHLLCNMIDSHLLSHPFIEARGDLHEQVQQAVAMLASVYQKIGEEHL